MLVPRYGIVVAAVVTVASEVLILAGSYVLMRRYFGFFPLPRTLVPALLAAAVMAGVLWLLRRTRRSCCWCRSAPRCTAGCCGRSARRAASSVAGLRA